MTAEDAINVFKEQFCGLELYCELHADGLCITENCEIWWALKALEQYKADAVEVVRCKDCRYFNKAFPLIHLCNVSGMKMDADDYCSYGKKKDG